ncbi:ABC transporter ATP-binding protein [Oenococcus kitaharae]|uniref:ABC-type multidrug/protein/lipid transport system ATPase component n=1 Tax=Oenococcus kitaharae DSM 17330 TaxID=1045004 RepID=G9WIV0_9LACO|nr:ABC transporter ATP-binding protein [Oenococcus kitaharae]EHN58399.1 ABC-type multidrug/protein/lipid transport system ATPase component [Oenococcus kitaharae DSM 17330]MCV3296360.1 ABC transporter ATP-binding protein/permease [Oenococcus kitaharae]OEY81438.1 multidrug ABC transporter ATP-binding protein [Oenococcus kitaharae]OEY82926.1 multidrug ABC transporter ATP-binding protein [Oenococcus kitaharae]OEY84530.1 multidrug ABC transporter ATP-binding protein [Oenococcus kitaharae]
MIKLSKGRMSAWIVALSVLFMIIQVYTMLRLPDLTSDLINNGVARGNITYIYHTGAWMAFYSLLSVLFGVANTYTSSVASQKLGMRLRRDIYDKVMGYSNEEFDKIGTSSLITRTSNDVVQIQNVVMMFLRLMIMSPIMLIAASVLAYGKSARLTEIFLVAIPVLILIIGVAMYYAVPLFKAMQKKTDRINLVFREGLTGVRVIRAFGRDQFEQDRFKEANQDFTQNAVKVFSIMSVIFPLVTLVMSGTNVGITWFGGHLIADQAMQVGDLVAFMTYAMQVLLSFMMLAMIFVMVPRAQASADRINELLQAQSTIKDPAASASASQTASLVFKNVGFKYTGAEDPALSGVTFSAKSGQTVAIIGGTGSGKSTLINLIPRFYDVTTGSIQVNSQNISDYKQENLRDLIALTPQKAILFTGTIRENLKYGNPQATDMELWHALDVAQASDFVKELVDGLDAHVEQGGDNFSGGQKQRLAIARALVKKAAIYIFDDSFSALDFKTDAKLRAALKTDPEIQKAVVVIVAQRISTVVDADTILVLEDGRMTGAGTHAELKKSNQAYQEIIDSQIRKGDQ